MFEAIPSWLTLVGLSANFTIGGALLLYIRQQRHCIRDLEMKLDKVNEQLLMVSDSGKGVGRKVVALDQRLKSAERKQKEFEANDVQQVSYNEAVRLLSLGANVDDVMTTCGLSRAEADLIKVLHNSQVSSQARYR
ncbi:hypothetical protein BTA51_12880 [Hahella sp. CCB-MM4]|uniref:DUF2802 domain-containing protein n=1 Tax=Hahella sp. (strain CCB-MM4) TaxID=1926491 RepID=UPI000B9BFB15|nr:DUF2802 domain-containing protein [Hahella sp. CCB-MM4]OZG72863.1 hypothetical protein BTA51_12880 [Hahella sp. CCB-MM4]